MAQIPRTNKRTQSSSLRRIIVGVGVGVVIIIAALINMQLQLHKELEDAQKDMQLYLQQRYNQEFVVERPERSGGGFAVEGYIVATAYPKTNNELKFEVKKSMTDTWDGYVDEVWAAEETNRLRPKIDEIMSGVSYEYNVKIGSYSVRTHITPPIPSLDDFLASHGDSVLYLLEVKSGDTNQDSHYSRVILLMRLIKGRSNNIGLVYRWSESGVTYTISLDEDTIGRVLEGSLDIRSIERIKS